MLSTIFLNPFGAILDLPEEDAALRMGFYPKYQAVVTASCDPPKPEITAMWPWGIKHSLNNGGWSDEKSTNEFPDITMELMNVAPTCANKYAISEPCVNHNPNAPTFFKCKYTGKAGSVEFPVTPKSEWVYIKGVRTNDVAVTVNCTSPPYSSVIQAVGYDGTELNFGDGADMYVSLSYSHNSTDVIDIPYTGQPGGNLVHYYDFMTPPTSPAPPTPPPPPLIPCNELICKGNNLRNIQSFNFYAAPKWPDAGRICWTSRTDSMSSNTWHSKCNSKGATIYIAEVTYSSKVWTIGGYTRQNWYSSGYGSDQYGAVFTLSPNVFKSMAGSGPHGGYNYAIYKSNGYGPTFGGGHDWNVASNMKTGYTSFGHNYKCRVGNYGQNACRADMTGSYSAWSITESEMWSTN